MSGITRGPVITVGTRLVLAQNPQIAFDGDFAQTYHPKHGSSRVSLTFASRRGDSMYSVVLLAGLAAGSDNTPPVVVQAVPVAGCTGCTGCTGYVAGCTGCTGCTGYMAGCT